MMETGEVAVKYRENEIESPHIIELQKVRPHHKTQKIKNLLLCRKAVGREGERNLGRAFCLSGRKQLFCFEKQMKVKPLGNTP